MIPLGLYAWQGQVFRILSPILIQSLKFNLVISPFSDVLRYLERMLRSQPPFKYYYLDQVPGKLLRVPYFLETDLRRERKGTLF